MKIAYVATISARKEEATMKPMRRSLCVLFFLLVLLSAASVAQVGNTARPAPTTRVIGILSAMTLEIETLGPGTHGQDGNDRPGGPVHDRELERQKGCAYPLGDGESECSYGGYSTCRAVPANPRPLHRDRWRPQPRPPPRRCRDRRQNGIP